MTDLDRLVAVVDAAPETAGVERNQLTAALELPLDTVLDLARQAVKEGRVWIADRRLYSTAPYQPASDPPGRHLRVVE